MSRTFLDRDRMARMLDPQRPSDPLEGDLLQPCTADPTGGCMLPEHKGDCISYEDVVATPALANATPCAECGHYRGHAVNCYHTHKQHD